MKTIDKKKRQLQEDAIAFLRNGLYAENPNSCPASLYIGITSYYKEKDPETYEEELKIFKAMFNANNDNHKIALWNTLTLYYSEKSKFCRKDFSREEFEFIKAALKATGNPIYEVNINAPIETDRLILRAIEKSDFKLFAYHYKHDGDYELFCGLAPTDKAVKQFANRRVPTFFTIEEKNSRSVIGYIGLSIKQETATGLLEYYIFKEYRRRGYCKEAIRALIDTTLTNKLYEPVETVQDCVYKKKVIKLNAIRARISTVNTPSLKTIERCGFIYEATIHKTIYMKGFGWTDEKIYYIPREGV